MDTNRISILARVIRGLSIDGVESANSGHPGLPLGMADVASVLWYEFLKHNPENPQWFDRDRFILSAGHGSMLIYSLLHLFGYNITLDDLKNFRQWKSKTPGHPEYHDSPGVEITTGPLGQGLSSAVGMALAEKSLGARYNTDDIQIVDHYTYVIASDGDMQEGISHESSSFAGHNKLQKLIVLYDDNEISIDGQTGLSFSEDVLKRYQSYGWHTQRVDGHNYAEIHEAIAEARRTDLPSIIACNTIIGFGSPNMAGSEKVHGSPLGKEEARLTKIKLGLPEEKTFYVDPEISTLGEEVKKKGNDWEITWNKRYHSYNENNPVLADKFQKCLDKDLGGFDPEDIDFSGIENIATRSASGKVLDAIAKNIPSLLGGSADLTPSNKTFPKGEESFSVHNPRGRYIHYGVREHGMTAILNGMALHGGVIPYGGTFFVFTDYMRPSIRLAALMGLQSIYVLTHDSIGLGEDGPTHQPVEHLASLRAMPNLSIIRPMCAHETSVAWQMALHRKTGPTALILTRQNLPIYNRAVLGYESASYTTRGGYVLTEDANYSIILMGSGSEVEILVNAKKILNQKNIGVRLVSVPSCDVFDEQSEEYKELVLPKDKLVRLAMEAGSTASWFKYVGLDGAIIGLDHFGASAPYEILYEKFGLTSENVVNTALDLLEH